MRFKFLLLAMAVSSAVHAADKINVNEKSVREVLNLLLGKADAVLPTTFYYSGQMKSGKECSVEIHTRYMANPVDKPNGTSDITIDIDNNDKVHGVYFVGYDGEGPPSKFSGTPVQSYKSSTKKLELHMDDTDKTDKFASHWTTKIEFSSGHKLQNLVSIDSLSTRGSDETRSAECSNMNLDLALDSDMYDAIEKEINKHLGQDEKIEIFNGCSPAGKPKNGSVKVSCGFAIDQENDHQGSADFVVTDAGKITFVKLKMFDDQN